MPGVPGRPSRPKTCTTCGARFLPRSGAQKRCPTCRAWHALSKIDGAVWTAPPSEDEAAAARAVTDRG